MTEYNWDKFDKSVDLEDIGDALKEVEENGGGDYPDIPDGKYEVSIANVELGQSKKKDDGTGGDPMLKIQFKILQGEFANSMIFYNGVMQPNKPANTFAFQIHNVLTMLQNVWDTDKKDVDWNGSFSELSKIIEEIADDVVDNDEWQYLLEQKPAKNPSFKVLSILEVFE